MAAASSGNKSKNAFSLKIVVFRDQTSISITGGNVNHLRYGSGLVL